MLLWITTNKVNILRRIVNKPNIQYNLLQTFASIKSKNQQGYYTQNYKNNRINLQGPNTTQFFINTLAK